MYRELKRKGALRDAAVSAAQKTVDAMAELRDRGMEWWMAEEAVRGQWVLLPTRVRRTFPYWGKGAIP